MKLKLPLTEDHQNTIRQLLARSEARAALTVAAERKQLEALAHQAKLEADVIRLENRFSNEGDMDVLEELTSKKAQLALFRASIDKPAPRKREPDGDSYASIMGGMSQFLHPFLEIAYGEIWDEATATFAPFYSDSGIARQRAKETCTLISFCTWRSNLKSILTPKECVLRMADVLRKMLAQEDFWTFKPSPERKPSAPNNHEFLRETSLTRLQRQHEGI